MARQIRIDYPGCPHHVMNRGLRHIDIVYLEGDRPFFLDLLAELSERFGVVVLAYAIMGNHYHLLVVSLRGELSAAMQWLQSRYVQRLNSILEFDGPLFRGRFLNRVVLDETYWRHLFYYIHTNPVRAGVPDQVSRNWTSRWAWTDGGHPEWLDVTGLIDAHGSVEAYLEYEQLYLNGAPEPDGFDPEELWSPHGDRIVVPRGEIARPSIDEAQAMLNPLLRQLEAEPPPIHARCRPGEWLKAWWLVRGTDASEGEIANLLGVSQQSVSHRVRQLDAMRNGNGILARQANALEGRLRLVDAAKTRKICRA